MAAGLGTRMKSDKAKATTEAETLRKRVADLEKQIASRQTPDPTADV